MKFLIKVTCVIFLSATVKETSGKYSYITITDLIHLKYFTFVLNA